MVQQRRGRARLDRATDTSGTEIQSDVLEEAARGLLDAVKMLNEKASKGDQQAIDSLLKINSDEFSRARSGANNPVLLRILDIREEGSQKLYDLWKMLYRNGLPDLQEPLP